MRLLAFALLALGSSAGAQEDGGMPSPGTSDAGHLFEVRPPDAGEGFRVRQAVLDEQLPDGGVGRRLLVTGGNWLSDSYSIGFAGELADLRAQNGYLIEHGPDVPYRWLYLFGSAGIAVGIGVGFCLGIPGHCDPTHH